MTAAAAGPTAARIDEVIDFERLDALAARHAPGYASARPFPHVVLDDFLRPDAAHAAAREFDTTAAGWDAYRHYNENKLALTRLERIPPASRAVVDALHSGAFITFLEQLTKIGGLLPDPDLEGSGLHKVPRGGFLNIHSDFLCHTVHHDWSRQLNLLLYLNPVWRPEWNGDLEFWNADLSRCEMRIAPLFNRCVVFHTMEVSFHGHPLPVACPDGVTRKSLALYYFRREEGTQPLTATHYHSLPGDGPVRRLLVATDRLALRAYSFLRRHTPLSDSAVGRILKRL